MGELHDDKIQVLQKSLLNQREIVSTAVDSVTRKDHGSNCRLSVDHGPAHQTVWATAAGPFDAYHLLASHASSLVEHEGDHTGTRA